MASLDLLMITHNRLEYLKKALPSVLKQDGFRLIIWDNGSNKETVDWLKAVQDPRTMLILNKTNDSLASVTTQVFMNSDKEFVGKVDSDVILSSDWVSRLLNAHQKYHLGFIGGLHFRPEDIRGLQPIIEDFNGVKLWRKHHIGGNFIIRRSDFKGYGGQGVMGLSEYQAEMGLPNGYLWDPILWIEHMEDSRSEHYIDSNEYNQYKIKTRGIPLSTYQTSIINPNYMKENTRG